MADLPAWKTVKVEFEDGIAWVTLNRPEKRNAMSPALNREMLEVLDVLELDERCKVLVLTGAGDSFCAGMDLKEYFRETDGSTPIEIGRVKRDSMSWQWRRLMYFPKPTIAMVNGWCFGGAFTPLVSCDLSIAADEAVFGLSEINWGIIPAGNVTKAVADKMTQSDALYFLMTGENFDGKKAAETRLIRAARAIKGARHRTRQKTDEQEPARHGDDQAGLQTREGNELGCVGRLSLRQVRAGQQQRPRPGPAKRHGAVSRREILPSRPRQLPQGRLAPSRRAA
jgi:feruloyl-CoA hydratase/lyase